MEKESQAMRIGLMMAATALLATAPMASPVEAVPPVPMLDQLVRSDDAIFAVVSGRVAMVGGGLGTRSTSSTGPRMSESLQMRFSHEETVLSYQLSVPTDVFVVDISGKQTVRMEWRPTGKSTAPSVVYVQKPGQEVTLVVGYDGQVGGDPPPASLEAPSLWHLLLTDPGLCRQRLLPMLAPFWPQWDLEQMAKDVERGLLQLESRSAAAERARWAALLDQLDDDSYARREAADRELRAAGPCALGFLRRQEFSSLRPEQQYRVRRMLDVAVSTGGTDTVDEVVAWLSGDVRAWLALASRPELAVRQTAAARLADLLGEPTGFEPDAADPQRARQLDELRKRLR